ncbi:response regulator transcription factor [Peptostreptococcus sp. D1]|uniref:response regulator transcription factor n=1 Tax=Peptostreptococcus sp. D1 TaxID=72304 RepID=UPI0008E0083F|nr:response regulator transcription factor [Peptostreptococcus sp. D1]SFE78346.1 DNA-binding response regulator, OmpR family, contains REC and winged-helix (wHTH) domain [Peptostreptococcus sp. D1]
MRILVVEDEVRLSEAIGQILENEKYEVDISNDGEDGLDYAMSGIYDAIILDVMLPKINGFDVVRNLRKNKIATPVIMLTAKDEIIDKVTGLDFGADDYMTKPFVSEELLARIRALTRRQGEVIFEELEYEDIKLNLSTYTLQCGVKSVHLSHKELEIMKLMLSNPALIVSKEMIITKVWGYDSDAEDNNVEVYISFLRKKLFFVKSKVNIGTVRKVGYRLEYSND